MICPNSVPGIVTTSTSHTAPLTSPNGNTASPGNHQRLPPPPTSAPNTSASPGPSPMKQDSNHPFNSGMFAAAAAAAAVSASGGSAPPEFAAAAPTGFPPSVAAAAAGLNHTAITQWLQLQQQEAPPALPPPPPPQRPRTASPVKDEPMSPRQGSTHSSGSASGNGSDYATL